MGTYDENIRDRRDEILGSFEFLVILNKKYF